MAEPVGEEGLRTEPLIMKRGTKPVPKARQRRENRYLSLTRRLTAIHSWVGTDGEARVARELYEHIGHKTHFRGRAKDLILVPIGKGSAGILAFYQGDSSSKNFIILAGHIDTVDAEDFGGLAEKSGDSEAIQRELMKLTEKGGIRGGKGRGADQARRGIPEDVVDDLISGRYEWGRGWLDMKSGVAVQTEVFLEMVASALPVNLVLFLEPDEEGDSAGARALIPLLSKELRKRGGRAVYLINADYTSPVSTEDKEYRHIYSGTIGKMLVGISVFGKETHVGQPFEGLNALALASLIGNGLDANPELVESFKGEKTPPPTLLRIIPNVFTPWPAYSVKTGVSAHLYVNLFFIKRSPDHLISETRRLTQDAVKEYGKGRKGDYIRGCEGSTRRAPIYDELPEVLTYSEFRKRAEEALGTKRISRIAKGEEKSVGDLDLRLLSLRMLSAYYDALPERNPVVVISVLHPFYESAYFEGKEINLIRRLSGRLGQTLPKERFEFRNIYPYISDISFFSIKGDLRRYEVLNKEMPVPIRMDRLKTLSRAKTTSFNIGPYGKGAHGRFERVEREYAFETLPTIIKETISLLSRRKR